MFSCQQFLSHKSRTFQHLCATMKNTNNFCYAKEAIMCTTKLTHFAVEHKGGQW